jgi:hypothetical protein
VTAPASSVPAVRQWLYTTITAAVASFTQPGVEVYLSQEDHQSTQDLVVIQGAHRRAEVKRFVGGGGPFWMDELYTIDVVIACYVAGPDAFPAVDVRAYAVLAAIETAVRADPSAGGNVVQINPEGSASEHEWDEDGNGGVNGGQCHITLTLSARATQ